MKIIINESEKSKKDYKEIYKKFGKWDEINKKLKSENDLLNMIFEERASKTIGGCKFCNTPYINFTPIVKTRGYRCKCQKTKVFPLKGTHFENYKKSLNLMMRVMYEMMTNKNGISSLSLLRKYRIDDKSANLLTRRISDWFHWYLMHQTFKPRSIIEVDEVYPKFNSDLGEYYPWKKGKGSERTHGVLTMCERDGLSLAIPYDKRKSGEVMRILQRYIPVENKNIIFTDESKEYASLGDRGYSHSWVTHKKGEYGKDGGVNTNLAENLNSFIKNTIEFTHKGIYPDYMKLYMSRYAFIHCIRENTFEQCIDKLIGSLPPFNKSVAVNYKPLNTYRYAA